jgi:quercetin dioxygenase-like cupin family protein
LKKGNISSAPVKKVKKDYFTGPVTLREISGITKPNEHDMYHVIFKKSARTKLHFHTGAQMLIVTKGKGSLVYYKKTSGGISKFKISKTKTVNLTSGDVVYIPAKILHTHGSVKKNSVFSHMAINFYPKKNQKPKTEWYESDLRSNVTSKIP